MIIKLQSEFKDPILMNNYIKSYLSDYPPAGYDTMVCINIEQDYEQWLRGDLTYIVKIERLDSCD